MQLLWLLSALLLASVCSTFVPPQKAGHDIDDCHCILDPRITVDTLTSYKNGSYLKQIKQYLWATACGRSRGVFTLTDDPMYAGETYSCANWPPQWGIRSVGDWFSSPEFYKQHLIYLSEYLGGNYNTTANKQPNTCDFVGLAVLDCGKDRNAPYKTAPWAQRLNGKPFRGVNAGGIFVLEPWITPGFAKWSLNMSDQWVFSKQNPVGTNGYLSLLNHWNTWYDMNDFNAMKAAGLNSIRLPVGWWYWAADAGLDATPYTVPPMSIHDKTHPITRFIAMAGSVGLVVVLDLHGAPGSQNGLDNSGQRSDDPNPEHWGWHWFYDADNQAATVKVLVSMAKYVTSLSASGLDNVVAIELLNEPWVFGDMSVVRDFYRTAVEAIRLVSDIPLIMHDAFRHSEWEWLLADWPYKNTFMDTHIYHAFNSDDIASSNIVCDRNKMIVAENIACGYGSMLRFKTGVSLPVFVGEFSLAVDDCMGDLRGAQKSVQFQDFGQCKNLQSRVGDKWWVQNYQQLALRQMSMAERELGWFFWTWKTGPAAKNDPSNAYWSYSDAIKANIIPSPLVDKAITEACYEFLSTEPYTC